MAIIPSNQYTQFFRSLTGEQQTIAQGMYDELARDARRDLRSSAILESLDGTGGSQLDPATGPPFSVRITVTGIAGQCIITPDGTATSTLQLQG